jgi:hypothetical protein
MQSEAIVMDVRPGSERTIGKSLRSEFVHVSFQVPEFAEKQVKPRKVTIKEPGWLSELQPAAPIGGYLMEHGEFLVEFANDPRLKKDLLVTVEIKG